MSKPVPVARVASSDRDSSHSADSDGEQSVSELATLATGNGLDFLAVTEHNTISHLPHLPRVGARHDITLLPGQEVTTPTGHANAIGDIGWRSEEHTSELQSRGQLVCRLLLAKKRASRSL